VRVAVVGPLPPAASGIADYSAELVPALAEHLAVELFPPPGSPPPDRRLAERFPVRSWRDLADPGLDVRLVHLGNDHRHHGALFRALPELPSPVVVVLHEYVLHHMVREMTLVAGDAAGYVEALRAAYGAAGESVAHRAVGTGVPLDPFVWPLFEPAVDAAAGVIVHNETTRRRVLASRPGARVAVVPHHVAVAPGDDPAAERRAARRRLGLADDVFLVGTFGFQTPPKRLDVLLRAFARLRAGRPAARLAVVGAVDRSLDLERKLDLDCRFAGGLAEAVTVTGHVAGLDDFLDWMRAVDVAVNLRHPTGGETSGTVIRLLGLGKPLVVTDAGAFAEIPDGCAAKVPPDEREEDVLAAYLAAFAADPALGRDLGAAARRHMAAHHSLAGSARAYAGFLAEVAASPGRPAPRVPPLVPWAAGDLFTGVLVSLAAAAADLGLDERDDDLLAALAAPVVELELDREAALGGGRAGRERQRLGGARGG
jgi:glycosyltransferase involved in cell wall biosynthesis